MELKIELASQETITSIGLLYDNLNDYLETHINYPGWIKGIYPTITTAQKAFKDQTLFVAKHNNTIVGSVILNHEPEAAYHGANWQIEANNLETLIVHTLFVSPEYGNFGIGKKLMTFILDFALEQQMKSVRLDVSVHNKPAIHLYESCKFQYIDTVDLGLQYEHLKWFHLYEYLI